ncbi:MAG: hypothetical protein ACI4XF_09260 [Oscillospiraceae bacterium]
MSRMTMDRKMRTEKRNLIIRRILYFFLAAIAFVIISTVRTTFPMPLLLIDLGVCAAVFEFDSPVYCSVYGGFCGLLLDIAEDTLFCFNGIILTFCCLMVSLIFSCFLHRKLINFILLNFTVILVQGALHYLFYYLLWGYDKNREILMEIFIPELIATNIAGVAVFGVYKLIGHFLGDVREHYIEEQTGK